MRTIIFFLLVVVIILLIPACLKFSNNLLFDCSRKIIQIVETKQSLPGFDIQELTFGNARFSSFDTMVWTDISFKLFCSKKNKLFATKNFVIHLKSIEITLLEFAQNKFICTVDDFTVLPAIKNNIEKTIFDEHGEGFKKGRVQFEFQFNVFRLDTLHAQIKALYERLSTIVYTGRTVIPIDFSCISCFTINNESVKAMITTKYNAKGYYTLVVNKEFFKTIAWLMAEELTDAETAVLSMHPFKAPKLLRIMNIAKKESAKFKNVNGIPEDAYRHVLWSYLLTREYGPELSKKITDAHEDGDITNTEAEHQMDFNNNAVGRQYALRQYKKDEILSHLVLDPMVIRKAQE